ncbi:WD40-like Beta Propeller Repeat, partial [Candidatus Kryptonium thompsonii]
PLVVEGFNMKPVFYRNGDKREIYFVGNITGYTNIYKIDLESKTKPKIVIEGERSDKLEAFHLFKTKIDVKNDKLAFITKSGDHDAIHIYDLRSEKITDMFQFNSLVMITSLSFSPDAEKLAITAIDKSGYSDIYIFDLKTKNLKKLTNDFYDDREVAWSPKGDKIAFISDRMNLGSTGNITFSFTM